MSSIDTPTITVEKRPSNGRWLLGGLIVVLGLLLLLDTTELLRVDGFDVFLAGALVLYGGYRLVTERFTHLFWPATFVLVGAGWLLVEFGVLTGAQAGQFWPVLLVLFGVSIALGRRRKPVVVTAGESGVLTDGSDVVGVFSDARVDLRGVALEPPIAVGATAVFGDVEVVVPADAVLVTNVTSIFGEVKDLRRTRPTGDPDVVVDGVAVFGDVRISD